MVCSLVNNDVEEEEEKKRKLREYTQRHFLKMHDNKMVRIIQTKMALN